MIDAYTTSASYPYSRHYRLGSERLNYLRNSVKVTVDAYDGSVDFLRVRSATIRSSAAYRALFPSLFKDASAMPPDLRRHVRYPELMLELQAAVYGLYHMTDARGVLQPRGSLDGRQRSGRSTRSGEQATQPMEPNFVLMKLPGETDDRVRRNPAVHAGEPQQPDRLDCRAQRRRELRDRCRLRLPEDAARRRPAADRGAHRSERAAVRAALVVEPAGVARPARQRCW